MDEFTVYETNSIVAVGTAAAVVAVGDLPDGQVAFIDAFVLLWSVLAKPESSIDKASPTGSTDPGRRSH